MRYRIRNELKKVDYLRLTELLNDNTSASVELFPGIDLEFISVGQIVVASLYKWGYSIYGEVSFQQPIGLEVYDNLKVDEEMRRSLTADSRNIKMAKIVMEAGELESDLNKCLKVLEGIVNHACVMLGKHVDQTFTIDSEGLDKQMDIILGKEELEKRGEIPKPFGTIHAKSSKDAKERACDLIPVYKEHDKTYFYDAKRVYFLLPHDFVTTLLRCDKATMVREEEFDKKGKEVLRDLVYKKHLRKHETLGGIVCYYGLNDKTRRYLSRRLKHKTSRL